MKELAESLEFLVALNLLFEEILKCLDVVIRSAFYVLNSPGVLLREVVDHGRQDALCVGTQPAKLRQPSMPSQVL